MSITTKLPIVGGSHHPPAKGILANLPVGAPLLLSAEPENEYDAYAVAVYVSSETVAGLPEDSKAAFEANCAVFSIDPEEVLSQEKVMLGYIPKGKNIEASSALLNGREYTAKFFIGNRDRPYIEFEFP